MLKYRLLSPRWRKVLADLWGNKLRTLLVVLSISVGVFAVGMVYSSYLMFDRDLTLSWKSAAPASASLYADPFDEELVDSVRSLRGVKEAEGRRNVDLRVRTAAGEWRQMYLTAIPDYSEQKVNIIKSQTGAWPPGDGDVLLERSSLSELGVAQGGSIQVETADGHKRNLKITGVVYDPSQLPSLFSGRSYGYINMDTLEKLDVERQLDQVNFVVEPWVLSGKETAPIEAVGRRAWSKLEQGNTTVFWLQVNKPGEHPLQSVINALIMLLTVLGVLSLLLGTFLLVNTVSAILTQQVRQIGIMKAIGARRDQILRMYLFLVGVYGALALIVAAPLGALAASAVTGFMAQVFNFNSGGLELPPKVLLLEATAAIVVPVLAAIWPIWHNTGVTVREAVSDHGIGSVVGKSRLDKWIDKLLARINLLSRPVLLSLRNTFRRKWRLALTLLTLTVAGTVFMAVFSIRASLYSTLDDALDYFRYDISVGFTQNYRATRIEHEILQIPGVRAAESWGFTSGRILRNERKESEDEASKNVFILAPPVNTKMIQPKIIEGRWLLAEDESALVVNSETLKDSPQLTVGSNAVIKIGNRKLKFTVVGIAKSTLTGPIVYAPYPWFTGAIQEAGGARSVQIVAQSTNPQEQIDLGRKIEQHLKKNNLRVQNVDITWEQKQRIRSQFDILIVFLLIMAVLLAFVGALGLMGTMGINVLERTREIGIMRAIGASSMAIAKVFVVEALCIGVLSWLLGVMLALPIAALLSYQVGVMFLQSPLEFSFSFLGVGIWLVLSALLAVAASLLPARKAAKLSVREVLGYE
ncbi:ABC transporter permease YtrF precursor [Sporomusa ovata DSM 2662]|uniref:Antimicrobial peptide ABC transporter permease n=1 Tax=Sporomusa ovata TaxID=2378 RepID=A0A0U1KTN9_9FIRM|nr:ABC transporter permease [Sporomusa ovata]EQB26704.1 ABC-type transport system, involved in lipoprotein release, permease component [Sporomusa ovata DSM 2662]CQR70798.1 Antimicrobial peptide ABC transporter permease [Sporomusa ovata]